jgi:hypothetical protein
MGGIAESIAADGILNAHIILAPLSGMLAALIVVKALHRIDRDYITLVDPFQEIFGKYSGSVMALPALLNEVLFAAAILVAQGTCATCNFSDLCVCLFLLGSVRYIQFYIWVYLYLST